MNTTSQRQRGTQAQSNTNTRQHGKLLQLANVLIR